ncbi:hypothetical protein PIROE2DRAFT_58654 [Piromyces sp. E2]|nr:hypothetical protein PIROE2DRAFT_58654 [Piromyces sp. E2]|eukprot:OUM67610.1 hypothetical protein PIROE2DRAFT_58654 [Piromyces sp. E2]
MTIQIRELDSKDYDIARQFSIEGMDIRRYTDRSYEIYLYSKYFFYYELTKATQILAAYEDDKLVGVLMVEMKDEPVKINSLWYNSIVKSLEFMMKFMFEGQSKVYEEVNEIMFNEYKKTNTPDGELLFFVIDPKLQGKGIGTMMLNELEKIEKGKEIYLFTDSGCNYQFYDHRNFKKEQVKDVEFNVRNKIIPLTCFLYSKVL